MNQINFHFFNVNNGDSILVEIITDTNIHYIVIDSCYIKKNNSFISPTLEYLKKQNAKTISAIIITHFHKDHYTGIENFFDNFTINKLCIPPVISRKSSSFDKIIQLYKKKIKKTLLTTNDDQIFRELDSLVFLIQYLKKMKKR